MTISLNEQYWSSRYHRKETGWDIGTASKPIKQYLDQIGNKDLKILIPGAGNAHEAAYAYEIALKRVHILDISGTPLANFRKKCPEFPENQIHHEDFFFHQGKYDLIIEHTFFAALLPSMRPLYVKKMGELLKTNGKLVGLLFNKEFDQAEPPFGGSKEVYLKLFQHDFDIQIMEEAYNSIPPRMGSELFIKLQKK